MTKKRPSKKRKVMLLLLLLLLLIVVVVLVTGIFRFMRREKSKPVIKPIKPDTTQTAQQLDTTMEKPVDTLPETDTVPETKESAPRPEQTPPPVIEAPDTAVTADTTDTTEVTAARPDSCLQDTIAPWVYPDPSGGLHRQKIEVALHATKPCLIEWKFEEEEEWKEYTGDAIPIDSTTTLHYRGVDSCGNQMLPTKKRYEIILSTPSQYCPEDMEYIEVGTVQFCIDRYEWPNKRGVKPRSYISVYHAMDSCFSIGKRLCSMDEWLIACSGPYSWKYPYSQKYAPNACVTRDTTARKSGSKRECRGYFDVYDMSGNLAEWTSTRSTKDRHFYNVMGGFWKSGIESACHSKRYSYFPQNQHNPVGFRCCADAAADTGKK
ncbi:MAG: SUMF1/EgtB/PvdO family nonheme iron enzyme [Chitinivibrionales bacterium]|nr:SUMF1/EgtB/PvdO family nonheme iron enzyme [Chitinivibrionales bacterium]